ncbi:MAG: adenine deaminase [Bacteroidales bacterium]|nr:adenine deaminase [Bacteroidales bacterium]
MKKIINGNIVDVINQEIFSGEIHIENKKISKIIKNEDLKTNQYILPGLVDSHLHIESSMLTPGRFAQLAVKHGTVATVSDPHEIANVLGIKGVDYMIKDGKKVPFKFYFGAPSCVPATPFETSGAVLGVKEVRELLEREDIKYLSEMMNFPGVINNSEDVVKKLNIASKLGKPIDGHAPGLAGEPLKKYINAGISTDHECYSLEEAEEKIALGMYVQIREGSAARNFETLFPLIDKYPGKIMLCSDDLHPDDLSKGHINSLIKAGLKKGLNLFNLLMAVTIVPKFHYGLDTGLLRKGDPADLIVIDKPEEFNVKETWINGEKVFEDGNVLFKYENPGVINNFYSAKITLADLKLEDKGSKIRVIRAYDGGLLTTEEIMKPKVMGGELISDASRDLAKIVVLNRYKPAKPVVGFITGFGLEGGAFASSIAHDSHNLIAIGMDDRDILNALKRVIDSKGGIALSDGIVIEGISLDIAGLMSTDDPEKVASAYAYLNKKASGLCTKIKAPFMTLAFMALLVIPELKISDRGLFNVNDFKECSLYA